jgi:DnaJ-class molecular chaperone
MAWPSGARLCIQCKGTGSKDHLPAICPRCSGYGYEGRNCGECLGTGIKGPWPCWLCAGIGRFPIYIWNKVHMNKTA